MKLSDYQKGLVICAFAAVAMSLFLHPPALAYRYCINATWMGENATIMNNGIPILNLHEPTYCQYGCDSKLLQCNPSDWVAYTGPIGNWGLFGMIAAILFIVIGLMYLASRVH